MGPCKQWTSKAIRHMELIMQSYMSENTNVKIEDNENCPMTALAICLLTIGGIWYYQF